MTPATLPRDFPSSEFKGLGSGASEVIALPFQLSGGQAPASGVQPLTQSFIGSSGFAVTYVTGLFKVEAIRQAVEAATFWIYHLRFRALAVGAIGIVVELLLFMHQT